MASGQFAVACHQIGRLFGAGTTAGLSEGQLLDRFVAHRDGASFEAIVARHGPMVLAVCRSLLRDPNDVDDAFQATFLVLVRKAETLRRRDLLGGWLHAVAGRVARRARYDASRRRDRESKHPAAGWTEPEGERRDLRAAVHAELDRLPESYRLAVLLCDLQGRTQDEAARELGWPVGTVKGRLSRARALLRDRLSRRGLAPAAGAVALLLTEEGRAAVPPALLDSTASAASAVAAGPLAIAGAASARVLELTQGALTTMPTTKMKLAATALVVAALAGPGASAYQVGGRGGAVQNGPAAGSQNQPAALVGRGADQAGREGDREDPAASEERRGPRELREALPLAAAAGRGPDRVGHVGRGGDEALSRRPQGRRGQPEAESGHRRRHSVRGRRGRVPPAQGGGDRQRAKSGHGHAGHDGDGQARMGGMWAWARHGRHGRRHGRHGRRMGGMGGGMAAGRLARAAGSGATSGAIPPRIDPASPGRNTLPTSSATSSSRSASRRPSR